MWWKALSVVLIVYTLIAGTLVPLKPGITYISPQTARSGHTIVLQLHGYNSFYTKSPANEIRVWLQYDSAQALTGEQIRVLNDTTLEASFQIPTSLPRPTPSVMLNAIIDHPSDGVSLLPSAVEVVKDSMPSQAGWNKSDISHLHIKKDFSFPYRNVIYESIRNTYFHVPMWFVLMFLFVASAWNSVQFLRYSNPAQAATLDAKKGQSLLDFDRKASAYAEAGLLFGILGLITGMLWAHYAWGAAWSNDIKQLMTAVALLVYLAYFILRRSFDEPEKGARLGRRVQHFCLCLFSAFTLYRSPDVRQPAPRRYGQSGIWQRRPGQHDAPGFLSQHHRLDAAGFLDGPTADSVPAAEGSGHRSGLKGQN